MAGEVRQGQNRAFLLTFADSIIAYYCVAMIKPGYLIIFSCFTLWRAMMSRADEVVMQNGDILNGEVLSMNTNTLVLQDDNLGTVTLTRTKITTIVFGKVRPPVPWVVTSPNNPVVMHSYNAAEANS